MYKTGEEETRTCLEVLKCNGHTESGVKHNIRLGQTIYIVSGFLFCGGHYKNIPLLADVPISLKKDRIPLSQVFSVTPVEDNIY